MTDAVHEKGGRSPTAPSSPSGWRKAVADEIGVDLTAIRLSPCVPIGGLDEGPESSALYRELIAALAPLKLAYLHLMYAGNDELLA